MNLLQDQTTVGEIAARYPASVRVFEKHRIDFCCGGKTPLADACRTRGIEPGQLLAELADTLQPKPAEADNWNEAPLGELVDHILRTHHDYLKSELPRLSALLAKVTEAHRAKHGDMLLRLGEVFEPLRQELEAHLMKEETMLFPLVRGLETARATGRPAPPAHCGSVNNPIRVMMFEHDAAGEALALLRQITDGYRVPDGACNTFRALFYELAELEADLHRHIHLENNILFPRAAGLEVE